MIPIIQFLRNDILLDDKNKARLLKLKATRYILYYEKLYRRGFFTPFLKCADLEEGNYILQETHEGVCGNHVGAIISSRSSMTGILLADPKNRCHGFSEEV